MISVKSSFSDCKSCKLLNQKSCILETNCKNFEDVEVIFVAENPGQEEIEKGVPLTGGVWQTFKKYLKKYKLDKRKQLLTNVVLCQTLGEDGKPFKPSNEIIDFCKINCFEMIKRCNPKLIVLMGDSAKYAFGVDGDRGKIIKKNDQDILLTFNPNYLKKEELETFEADIRKVYDILEDQNIESKEEIVSTDKEVGKVQQDMTNIQTGVFYYKIPDKFYTDKYRLVDVQPLSKKGKVLFIFRDHKGNRVTHTEKDDLVFYETIDGKDSKLVMSYDQLKQIKIANKDRRNYDLTKTYEGDIKVINKHCQDYYLQRKVDESGVPFVTAFLDIETYSNSQSYAKPDNPWNEIALITLSVNNRFITYVLNPTFLKLNGKIDFDLLKTEDPRREFKLFNSERELLTNFLIDFRNLEIDIVSGWFSDGFDWPYICGRCEKLGLDFSTISKFGDAGFNYKRTEVEIKGTVILDYLFLYKWYAPENRESYSLDFISKLELKCEGKLGEGKNFSNMYRNDPTGAIRYNINDVVLVEDLHKKLKYIELHNQIRIICKTSIHSSKSSLGQLDCLLTSFLKEKGISSKTADIHDKDEKFAGAYVKEPVVGLHDYIVDFDFTSLYPSIILTYNIGVNTFAMKFKDKKMGYDYAYDKSKLPEDIILVVDPTFSKREIKVKKEDLLKRVEEDNLICTINGCFYKPHENGLSFYSEILEYLLGKRKQYKKLMLESKDPAVVELNDTKQLTFKILANALYGILGNNAFRFYNLDCAESITLSGQESLKNTIVNGDNFVDTLKTGKEFKYKTVGRDDMYSDEFNPEVKHIITGDTDSVFITYKKFIDKNTTFEQAMEKIEELNEKVYDYFNKDLMPSVVIRHSNNLDKNRLFLKTEFIMKRGLFLAKKRYANHVIRQEGKEMDKIKAMGIEIKRSDYSSFTKDKLKELLDLILKGKDVNITSILNFVKEGEKEIMRLIKGKRREIGRPVSFVKDLNEYKVIPQGVKGMVNWNMLEYDKFSVGAKGYLFKLLGLDLTIAPKDVIDKYTNECLSKGEKIDEIVVPDDIDYLPNYYIVDERKMLDFAWIDRYNLLLEPILPKRKVMTF